LSDLKEASIPLTTLQIFLKTKSEDLRFAAGGALGDMKSEAAVPYLADVLKKEPDLPESVVRICLISLGKIGKPFDVKGAVLPYLKSSNSHILGSAFETLEAVAKPEGDEEITKALEEYRMKDQGGVYFDWAGRIIEKLKG
jgi:HEAT repeat protein